jgi:L-alanine-DL-glutamate epimerase-like enolase superfamily enzyme
MLEGRRPREAGCNARLAIHGITVRVPIARLRTDDGTTGIGFCSASREQASALLGKRVSDVFAAESGSSAEGLPFDFPLWDLAGQRANQPVYALAATMAGTTLEEPFHVPCYDTSLYIDDLHLASDDEAAELIAGEAREGYARGHRSFKIKVGRGARHMPLEDGMRRDITVIRAVREAVSADCAIMIDANNGYNLNITKHVLTETTDCNVFWLEEAFHEDPVLYGDLREWLDRQGSATLIADGEGLAAPPLLDWAEAGFVDVVQYDIFSYGFTRWLETGRQLDGWGVRTAPHHYGRHIGNYVSCHLAGAVRNFTFTEWDETTTPGIEADGYVVKEGWVTVPASPGFGLTLDDSVFRNAVASTGFTCTL